MSTASVVSVAPGSPAESVGLAVGDTVVGINGRPIRDVIEYRWTTDAPEVHLDIDRGGLTLEFEISKPDGVPLGIEVDAAVFDRVRTCDNHCEFCFIYQLPKGMRRSLYLKDDDYRLSFLYGNFTTLTRFTEADLERVITEGLSPLYVSIHATDPAVRSDMLRNKRGAMSLRWLRALLDAGIEIHGQVVVCPDLNDGAILDDTLCGILDEYPELTDVAVVPLGLSKFSTEERMRLHTPEEANAVCEIVEQWQQRFTDLLGRPLVYASDEYYLIAGRELPPAELYGEFSMHEDGIGMIRAFQEEFTGDRDTPIGVQSGFFAWVDGAPAEGYRAPRTTADGCGDTATATITDASTTSAGGVSVSLSPRTSAPVAILTGSYGQTILQPLIDGLDRNDVRVLEVRSEFFGGNVGVAGLMVGDDIGRVLSQQPVGHRYLLPDVCLSEGRFLDGSTPDDLPHPVEVIETNGVALRKALA